MGFLIVKRPPFDIKGPNWMKKGPDGIKKAPTQLNTKDNIETYPTGVEWSSYKCS